MKKSSLRRVLVALCAFGLLGVGTVAFAAGPGPDKSQGDPNDITSQGDISFKAVAAKSLKGRVYGHWADNPDGEIMFGIQYWNTTGPAETGNPPGRASDDRNVALPESLFVCCGWGYQGGTDKNNPYAGWYNPQTTVRLAVKDKALMDQIMKAAQDFVAMEVTLDGRTVTGFKVMSN
ncbi:MAG: hypothetical protein AB7T38_06005 [Nitrospirales bacterium]